MQNRVIHIEKQFFIDAPAEDIFPLGNRDIANTGREKIVFMFDYIYQMLTHYCENGEMITLAY